jgi:hypothetical protein
LARELLSARSGDVVIVLFCILAMPAAERVTVTLRADLLEEIDKIERNRSRFIAEAVEHDLAAIDQGLELFLSLGTRP